MKISREMMTALKEAGLAREWSMGSMQRLYLDLAKLNRQYSKHIMDLPDAVCFPANSKEIRTGKVWIDIDPESETFRTMDFDRIDVDAEYLYKSLTALFAVIFPEIAIDEVEETPAQTEEATTEEDQTMTITEIKKHITEQSNILFDLFENQRDTLRLIGSVCWEAETALFCRYKVCGELRSYLTEIDTREEFDEAVAELREEYSQDNAGFVQALDRILSELSDTKGSKCPA